MLTKQAVLITALAAATASAAPPSFPRLHARQSGYFPTGTTGPIGTGTGLPGPTGTGTPSKAPKLSGVTAYWGQSGGKLDDVCNDDSFSQVILSFVTNYFGAANMPAMNLAAALNGGPSPAQKQAGATDLLDGTPLIPALKKCQSKGKKVFISLGGELAQPGAKLADDQQGAKLADNIWDLFLGGHNNDYALRPFGDVVLDGVDLDIENGNRTGYNGFVDQMRNHYKSDSSHNYYITAAPQCPRNDGAGDASLSDSVLRKVDAAWVQFYNNPAANCNHGEPGFIQSVQDWSAAIAPAQLWIGAPGGPTNASAQSGYVATNALPGEMKQIYGLNLPNIGGYMLWDAFTAMNNSNYQQQVAAAIKADNSTSTHHRRFRS